MSYIRKCSNPLALTESALERQKFVLYGTHFLPHQPMMDYPDGENGQKRNGGQANERTALALSGDDVPKVIIPETENVSTPKLKNDQILRI